MLTRRTILKGTTSLAGAIVIGGCCPLAAAAGQPLIDAVAAACKRLAPLGWRQMLLDVTGGELDITAPDLRAQLAKPLDKIDRGYPGYGDFDVAGNRGIEAGRPEQSLLYHAIAAPTVATDRHGQALAGFPTLAEIDAIENYVYGVAPPNLQTLVDGAAKLGDSLAIAVFALQYRNTPQSALGRHAELCFARAGIARMGTIEPQYNERTRAFEGLDPARPFEFRVVPQRFAAFLAVKLKGDRNKFGPQDFLEGETNDEGVAGPDDATLDFWVPIHKLFNGRECIAGYNLALEFGRGLRNEEIARFHRYLEVSGYENNWRGADLDQFPFTIRDERIASFSTRSSYCPGVIEPRPASFIDQAEYKGKPLTFPVDPKYVADESNLEFSSLQVLPAAGTDDMTPTYKDDRAPNTQRPAPEYLNIRHRLRPDGTIDNLNKEPDLLNIIRKGGYQALHYIDYTGDGWVEAKCQALEDAGIRRMLPAYCMVAPPDFFPKVRQRDLMLWWKNDVPAAIRDGLWPLPPLCLSQTRIAANIELPIGFSIEDVTVTAIVTQPRQQIGPPQEPNAPVPEALTGLPDASPGIFDPGWDTSQGLYFTDTEAPIQRFLASHGLGSPFIEDAKLCAALGNYWPGVSPDATRTFQPLKFQGGQSYAWPTNAPLTDEEIGIVPAADGKYMPWDGVHGPVERTVDERRVAAYEDEMRADYIDLPGTLTAALTSRIDLEEYKSRVLAMEAVYWVLGIRKGKYVKLISEKAKWAVRSFVVIGSDDAELTEGETATGAKLGGPRCYRFEVFRWGKQTVDNQDPANLRTVLVEMLERVVLYVAGNIVLFKRDDGPWRLDTSLPT